MSVIAFDPLVSAERFRELGVEKAASVDEVYARADFISLHLPLDDETRGMIDAAAIAKMRDGVRILNVARGGLLDDAALQAGLESGKVAGAALDVFPSEPITDYPLFTGYPNVVVTPHLGASTAEATDRAGLQSAEQIVAALTGGRSRPPSTSPRSGPRRWRRWPRSCRSPSASGASRWDWRRRALGRAHRGRVPRPDRRPRHAPADARGDHRRAARAHGGGRQLRQRRVDSRPSAGIVVEEHSSREAEDFNELIRVAVHSGGTRIAVGGTGVGPSQTPHLAEVWRASLHGRARALRLDLPLPRRARHDRPSRHALRALGHQHLLRRGRPPGRRAQRRRRPRRDGRDDRPARARRRSSPTCSRSPSS